MNGCKLRKFNPFWLKNDEICLGFNFSCRKDTLIRQSLDNGAKISVVKLEGVTWIPVGTPGFPVMTDSYPSLALDVADVPYVAFQGDDSRLSVMKYTEGAWVFVGQPDTSLKPGYFPSMMLDATGVPHVAYLQYASPGFKFWMKKFERCHFSP